MLRWTGTGYEYSSLAKSLWKQNEGVGEDMGLCVKIISTLTFLTSTYNVPTLQNLDEYSHVTPTPSTFRGMKMYVHCYSFSRIFHWVSNTT